MSLQNSLLCKQFKSYNKIGLADFLVVRNMSRKSFLKVVVVINESDYRRDKETVRGDNYLSNTTPPFFSL